MNRAQTSAIVLLLASAAAAYEQDAHDDLEEVRPIACVDAAMEADGPRPRRLLDALVAWASGRRQRPGREIVA
jgi:hypothetical protein